MMINDIYDNVPNECSYALYADDCAIWIQGRRLPQLVTTMQRALDTIQTWADNWGFTLTPSKCSAVIFSRYMNTRELHNITPLKIKDEVLSYNDDVKFLGVFFDSRLNPRPAGGGAFERPPSGFSRIAKKRRRAAPPGFHPPYPPSFPQLL